MCDVQSLIPGPLKAKMFDAAAKFLSTAKADDIRAVAGDLSKFDRKRSVRARRRRYGSSRTRSGLARERHYRHLPRGQAMKGTNSDNAR